MTGTGGDQGLCSRTTRVNAFVSHYARLWWCERRPIFGVWRCADIPSLWCKSVSQRYRVDYGQSCQWSSRRGGAHTWHRQTDSCHPAYRKSSSLVSSTTADHSSSRRLRQCTGSRGSRVDLRKIVPTVPINASDDSSSDARRSQPRRGGGSLHQEPASPQSHLCHCSSKERGLHAGPGRVGHRE